MVNRYRLETRNVNWSSTREWHSRNPFRGNTPWLYDRVDDALTRASILLMNSATHARIVDLKTGKITEVARG